MRQIDLILPDDLAGTLGVAVSGGGDSVALLLLLHGLMEQQGIGLACVTVDHGLRPEGRDEAIWVAKLCARLGISHEILTWQGWDGAGNIQNEARRARYRLMAGWAKRKGIAAVALGHTQNDQAETVLMRLARGAGVDGLSAMATRRRHDGITLLRPLLGASRHELRDFLRDVQQPWLEDPSNDETRFDRIKFRRALNELAGLGLDAAVLAQVAQNMQSARGALDWQTKCAAKNCAVVRAGSVAFDCDDFNALPFEIARRLIVAALTWVAGSDYAPRSRSVLAALEAVRSSGSATLDGCHLKRKSGSIWVCREFKVVRGMKSRPDDLWDDRWRLSCPYLPPGAHIAALGQEGLAACPGWRATGLPREVLLAAPSVWEGEVLHAAPHAGKVENCHFALEKGERSFYDAGISH